MKARKEFQSGVRYYDREFRNLNLLNLQFSSNGTQKLSLSGHNVMTRNVILRADGTVGEETTFTSRNIALGLLGAGAVVGFVLLVTDGDDDPIGCIDIFPKPPGCP